MMNENLQKVGQLVNRNSPAILTAAGVTGVFTTAYLAAKAGYQSARKIGEEHTPNPDAKEDLKEKIKLVWPLYIPPVSAGVLTIAAIGMSSRIEHRRAAAAVSAYAFTEKAFSEYKEKVVDEIGKHKEQVLRDELVAKQVDENPPGTTVLISNGKVLCCELYTGRYFESDHETLRKAMNDVNAEIVSNLYVTLDTFYDLIGLPHTAHSSEIGWTSDQLLELQFSTVMSEDGRPCLAFNYNHIRPI